MSTLHDRLADLADDAPPGGPVPGLWDRGRRYQRQRRTGTLVIAAAVVLALVGLGSLDWWRARPEPMPANGTPALPQKIWAPSPWLPGTDDAGPLGQLAAVQYASRGSWTGGRDGVVGISATGGTYRFLDLPDAVYPPIAPVALSPDGRHVAYWYSGQTRLSPHSDDGPVVGVAVYDTATGDVARHPVPSDHGLSAEDLAWVDADRVVLGYLHWRGGDADPVNDQSGAGDYSGLLLWDPSSGRPPAPLPGARPEDRDVQYAGGGRVLVEPDGVAVLDADTGRRTSLQLRPVPMLMYTMALDATGARVGWIGGNRNPNDIRSARVRSGALTGAVVPDSAHTFAVEAWLDDQHVAAVQRGRGMDTSVLRSVDLETGDRTDIVRYPLGTYGRSTQLATDLLDVPSVARPEPPRPLSPRAVAGGAALVVLGGIGALLMWRRRVGP